MNALKGAGPVHRSFDYDNPLTCHSGFSTYKARPKFQGYVLVSTDVRQTPKEDKTNLILRPKGQELSQALSLVCFAMLPHLENNSPSIGWAMMRP
jgi:hypothetical protein